MDVVDVVGDGQHAKGGEDGEEGGHGARHQQDNHHHHLVTENMTSIFVLFQKKSTCLVTELASVGKKAREAAAAMRKTRPPVIPSPSTTSYSWLYPITAT